MFSTRSHDRSVESRYVPEQVLLATLIAKSRASIRD
jgi:hypothetical protein